MSTGVHLQITQILKAVKKGLEKNYNQYGKAFIGKYWYNRLKMEMFNGEGTSTDINNTKSSDIYSKLKNMRVWDEKYINGKDASMSQKNIPTTQLK